MRPAATVGLISFYEMGSNKLSFESCVIINEIHYHCIFNNLKL